jgi:hypothetical protein
LCGRIETHTHGSFVNGLDRHELQPQFPPSRIDLRNAPQFQLPSLHRVLIKAGARNPIATTATTMNGQSATTQKERFHSGFLGVGFLFMLLSQAFEDRHFAKREITFGILRVQSAQSGSTSRSTRPGQEQPGRVRRSYREWPNELATNFSQPRNLHGAIFTTDRVGG